MLLCGLKENKHLALLSVQMMVVILMRSHLFCHLESLSFDSMKIILKTLFNFINIESKGKAPPPTELVQFELGPDILPELNHYFPHVFLGA